MALPVYLVDRWDVFQKSFRKSRLSAMCGNEFPSVPKNLWRQNKNVGVKPRWQSEVGEERKRHWYSIRDSPKVSPMCAYIDSLDTFGLPEYEFNYICWNANYGR